MEAKERAKDRRAGRPERRKSTREMAICNVKFAVSMGPVLAIVGLMTVYATALGFVALKHV